VQIKVNQIEEDGENHLIQLVDMTEHMLLSELKNNYQFNQFKSKNELLSMINACVSHELRNPLNSIIATNIEKKHLYIQLKALLNQSEINKDSCLEILQKLEDGNSV
jgi:signal transduction histidine kinase